MISGLMIAVASLFGIRIVIQERDEQPQTFMYLRRGQADAVILVHRLDHVVDEFLEQRILELGLVERPRAFPEHGMPHARDFQNGHSSKL